jgi:hypothetical protein
MKINEVFNMKKLNALILSIGLILIMFNQIQTNTITADDPISIFGYSEGGSMATSIENRIVSVWGEATGGDGFADCIMAGSVTAGLYEYVDFGSVYAGSLIAQTEVREVTVVEGSFEWLSFDFTGVKPSIVDGVRYYCVVSAESAPGNLRLMADSGSGFGTYQDETYSDVLPGVLTGELGSSVRRSIYCSYTVTSVGIHHMIYHD